MLRKLADLTACALTLLVAGCGSSGTTTVTVNSASCVQGAKVASKVLGLLGTAFQDAAQYPPLIEDAAKAGSAQDIGQIDVIAHREKQINGEIEKLNSQVVALNASFNPAAGSCS